MIPQRISVSGSLLGDKSVETFHLFETFTSSVFQNRTPRCRRTSTHWYKNPVQTHHENGSSKAWFPFSFAKLLLSPNHFPSLPAHNSRRGSGVCGNSCVTPLSIVNLQWELSAALSRFFCLVLRDSWTVAVCQGPKGRDVGGLGGDQSRLSFGGRKFRRCTTS